jgi:hypothetical protein
MGLSLFMSRGGEGDGLMAVEWGLFTDGGRHRQYFYRLYRKFLFSRDKRPSGLILQCSLPYH